MKLVATREDLAESLHTAMRKLCDSTVTSLAWNLINSYTNGNNEFGRDVWSEYLDFVWEGLPYVSDTITYMQVLKCAGERIPYTSYEGNSLRLTFALFTEEDFNNMGGFLYE